MHVRPRAGPVNAGARDAPPGRIESSLILLVQRRGSKGAAMHSTILRKLAELQADLARADPTDQTKTIETVRALAAALRTTGARNGRNRPQERRRA